MTGQGWRTGQGIKEQQIVDSIKGVVMQPAPQGCTLNKESSNKMK